MGQKWSLVKYRRGGEEFPFLPSQYPQTSIVAYMISQMQLHTHIIYAMKCHKDCGKSEQNADSV